MPDVREKLVELLNGKYDHYCDQCGVNKDSRYTENLADYLIANGVTIQRWIPVEERLPDPFYAVLVFDNIEKKGSLSYMTREKKWAGMIIDVTHWMPLPKLPKEDEDD